MCNNCWYFIIPWGIALLSNANNASTPAASVAIAPRIRTSFPADILVKYR